MRARPKHEVWQMVKSVLASSGFEDRVRWKENQRLEHLFESRCDRVPADRVAIVAEDGELTFRELDERANRTARWLLEQGLAAGDRIGVLLDKSLDAYVGLLAVLKIGAAYVPLDASFPAERVAYILGDAGVRTVVSVSRFREKLTEFDVRTVLLDGARQEIDRHPGLRLGEDERPSSRDDLFYVIYTSGTTGRPKGVAIRHSGICNFVQVAAEAYGIQEGDRCYQGITLAFDFHVEDLWVPLIAGATLVAGRSGASLFGSDLHAFLLANRVTVLPCVPTLWGTLDRDLPDVRIVLLSGESVPHNLVVAWHRQGRSILNAYGPTECSVSSTLKRLVPDAPVTIGRPLPSYSVVILDQERDEVAPDGAIGEIGIAGICLAEGYLNREDLTRQKFIPDFVGLPNNPSGRIYRTGDLGRVGKHGDLEFHGRIDTQIKLRGYRVELGEIEAVLQQLPQVAQAVVHTHEPEPGTVELVAYFTHKEGGPRVTAEELSETLRRHLPGYMVPSYVEELAALPMTSNNKVDRKALPPPKGPRFAVNSGRYVAPRSETEKLLEAAFCEIMKLERASVEDDFFQDLGAHSLLMARFGAELRKRLHVSSVSMQDIYQNPTIERLARHVDSLPTGGTAPARTEASREAFHRPSTLAYYGCGLLQLAWFLWWGAAFTWVTVTGILWTHAAMPDLVETYVRMVAFSAGLAVALSVLPIAAKWLLIGRFKQETFPVWSLRYFRFWVVKRLIRAAPMARFGDPFYNLYLRLLGAKIGKNTVVHTKAIPVCTDLISIGSNTVLMKDAILSGYRAHGNLIQTGPVRIGDDAFVGEHGILDIDTTMEDGTQLGHSSSLHEGQRVPRGKRYHGCPARETTANYCQVEAKRCSTLRRWAYSIAVVLAGLALVPVPLLVSYSLYPHAHDFFTHDDFAYQDVWVDKLHRTGQMLLLSLGGYLALVALGLLLIGIVPRLLNRLLRKDRTYVLYGFHYFLHRSIERLSNSVFYNRLFGDSSAIVHYSRWVGYELNQVVQTGSNFGMAQRHDNPFLCDIGSGTMVSGGLKMVNTTMSSTSFKLGTVKIGARNYLGNYLHIPSQSTVGENVLLATKVLVPIEGPVVENTGLLGSPSFEIPRATQRDLKMSSMDEATWKRRLRLKNRYNLVTGILYLAYNWFIAFALARVSLFGLLYYPRYGMRLALLLAAAAFLGWVFWLWLVEKVVLRFKRLQPQVVSMLLEDYYWFHERYWKLNGLWRIAPLVAGTPFKNVLSRLHGVRIGKRVFDDGGEYDEDTLVEIGDYTTINAECVIQPHSLEEGVFKSDHVKIGACCTLGVAANVHYGVVMGDHVTLGPDSFLMKGEIVDPDTDWVGNPARSVAVAPAGAPRREPATVPSGAGQRAEQPG